MINNIEVQKFKRFKNLVKIEGLSKVNYLVGKNNIGKSSFLQAVLLSTLYRNEEGVNFRNNNLPEIFARLKEYFNEEDLINPIKVIFDTDSGEVDISGVWREDRVIKSKAGDGRIPISVYIPCGVSMDITRDDFSFNRLNNEIKQSGVLPIQRINSWVFHHEKHAAGGALRGGESEEFKKLKSIMKDKFAVEILKPNEDDDRYYTFKYLENDKERNLYSLGSGGQNILHFIAAIVYLKNYDLVLIDEPELHLHPEIQKKLGLIFRELSSRLSIQFIIATQSPFIVSNLAQDDNVYLFKEKDNIIITKKENSFINVAVAMELGAEPSDVGAPDNFILTEEASLEILLRKTNDRFFKKNIQFIACSGINDIPKRESAMENIINHNKILNCTPIYLSKYFVITDKLTIKIMEDERVNDLKEKLGKRFIELDKEQLEDVYPEKYLNDFIEHNASDFLGIEGKDSSEKVKNWLIKNRPEGSKKRGLCKNKLAEFIGDNITGVDFRSIFSRLLVIFE